jgi:hypothetical protein
MSNIYLGMVAINTFCTSAPQKSEPVGYLLNQSRPGPHGAGSMAWESPFG